MKTCTVWGVTVPESSEPPFSALLTEQPASTIRKFGNSSRVDDNNGERVTEEMTAWLGSASTD